MWQYQWLLGSNLKTSCINIRGDTYILTQIYTLLNLYKKMKTKGYTGCLEARASLAFTHISNVF